MNMTVNDIADMVGGTVSGDGSVIITGLNGLDEAQPGDLCFVRSVQYLSKLETSQASAVFVQQAPEGLPIPAIVVATPDIAFAQMLKYCESLQLVHPTGVHAQAVIHPTAMLADDAAVGACAVLEAGVQVGKGAIIYPGVYVGRNCRIGAETIVYPNVTIREDSEIGAQCILHAGAMIGSDGFGFTPMDGMWMKIPQVGRVILEDHVEVGSGTSIDRATFGVTRIGKGTKIDNLVQIGHNVHIGEHCALAGMVGIAGSAVLEDHVQVGASAGIKGHLTVGRGATVAARGGVVRSVEAGSIVSGFPAIDHQEERRVLVAQRRVPELIRRVRELERALEALKVQCNEQTEND